MAHQYGATNVVSPLGTAITPQHVSILRRFADRIVLLFDADAAGDTAVNRAVELFLSQPIEIAIASMPTGLDPDEYLLQHGLDAFETLLRDATDVLTYKWKQLVRQFDANGNDLTGQQKAVQQYMETLAAARASGPVDSLRWGSALTRVSRLVGMPADALNRRFSKTTKKPAPIQVAGEDGPKTSVPSSPQTRGPLNARDRSERWILAILLAEPHRWFELQQQVHPPDFTDDARRQLAELYWRQQQDEGEPVFSEFLGTLEDPAVANLAVELVEEFDSLTDADARLKEAIAFLDEKRRGAEHEKQMAQLRRKDVAIVPGGSDDDPLRKIQEAARRPDLRRVGS
jgi:DNA primase